MPRHKYTQIDSTDILAKRSVSFPTKKSTSRLTHCISHPFAADPQLNQLTSSSPPQPFKHARARPLSPQIVHNVAPGPASTPMTIFPTTSFTRPSTLCGLRPREVEEPQCAKGRRWVAHRSVPLQKCANGSAAGRSCGEIMRGDAEAEGEEGAVGGKPNGRSLPPWRAWTEWI